MSMRLVLLAIVAAMGCEAGIGTNGSRGSGGSGGSGHESPDGSSGDAITPEGGTPPFDAATSTGLCDSSASGALNIVDFGAQAGTTDSQSAIQAALDAGKAQRKTVCVPAGTFTHSGVLAADTVTLSGVGANSVLHSTDPANESIRLRGDGPRLLSIKLTSNAASRLQSASSSAVWIDHATNYEVAQVEVLGAGSAGIFNHGSSYGSVHDNYVHETLADAIHMTASAHDIQVFHNRVEHAGDDGVACVSYNGVSPGNGPDSAYVRNVVAYDNVLLDNRGGRGISVVGGKHIEYHHNYIRCGDVGTAGIYLAQEPSYMTWEASDVYVHDNQVIHCGGRVHPYSLLVYSGVFPNHDIRIENNGFWMNLGAGGSIGLQGTNTNVTQSGNTTDVGAVPAVPF